MSKKVLFLFFALLSLTGIEGTGQESVKEAGSKNDKNQAFDVKFYKLDLFVSKNSIDIKGTATILLELLNNAEDSIVIDMGSSLAVDSVRINGLKSAFSHPEDKLVIKDIPAGENLLSLEVTYRTDDTMIDGLYNSFDGEWGNRVTWTLSEPFAAMNWFPCKQDLNDKADSVYVFITTERGNRAGSNGKLEAVRELPDNLVRYEWKCRHPVAYYLISFAVSDYRDYSFYAHAGGEDSVLVQNYIYDDDNFLIQNKSAIDRTSELISLFSQLFGPYPFMDEKYGHCIVPSGGGMEHQTMTTLENFTFSLVSHELAHQWFGDYVTCGSWQDIWLNEGFASYGEYLAFEYLEKAGEAARWMSEAQRFSKSASGSVYIPEEAATSDRRIFDYRLTYKKGAAIIHMIRHELGNDSLFFAVLRQYLSDFGNGNAIGMDMCDLLEEISGMDFTDFFNQWYFGEGYPVFSISWKQDSTSLIISSGETTSSSTPFFNMLIDFRIRVDGKDTLITRRQLAEFEKWEIEIQGKAESVEADPFHWLVADFKEDKEENIKVLGGR